jgi:DNA invertase Pin-like site-specific DNA recombinase
VLAVAAQLDRTYIREKILEGQQAAAARGNHGGRPKVIDNDTLIFARTLKDKGTPMPDIARKLVIKTDKNSVRATRGVVGAGARSIRRDYGGRLSSPTWWSHTAMESNVVRTQVSRCR